MKAKICALALSMTALAFTSQAQDKTTFGVRAGVNFTNVTGEILGEEFENDMKVGFSVGFNAEVPLAPEFYLQPGLLFSQKGSKDGSGDDQIKSNFSYLEVPINFIYKPTLGAGKLILGVGPYAGVAVGGSIKPKEGEDTDIEFGSDFTDEEYEEADGAVMKRFDFGGNLLAGYEFSNKFSFQLNAQLGLANLFPKINGEKIDDTKAKHVGFGVSLGYRF